MNTDLGNFAFKAFGLSLTANGVVALWLAVPVTIFIIAVAYRLVRAKPDTTARHPK